MSKNILNISGYIVFGVVDAKAKQEAVVSGNIGLGGLLPKNVVNGIRAEGQRYNLGEYNQTILDGSRIAIPNVSDYNTLYNGYISNSISNINGIFSSDVKIIFEFPIRNIDTPGITVQYLEEPPQEIYISTYKNNINYSTQVFNPTSMIEMYELNNTTFDRIEIKATKVLPYSRFKVQEVDFGLTYTFDNSEYIEIKILEQIDIMGSSNPANELRLILKNDDGKYDMFNPNSFSKNFIEKQKIMCYIDIEYDDNTIETKKIGDFYLKFWEEEIPGTITFVAYELTYFWDELHIKQKGMSYPANIPNKVDLWLNYLFNDLGLFDEYNNPLYKYINIYDVDVNGIHPLLSFKDALLYIMNSAVLYSNFNRDGILEIVGLDLNAPIKKTFENGSTQIINSELLRNINTIGTILYEIDNLTAPDFRVRFSGSLSGESTIVFDDVSWDLPVVTGNFSSFNIYPNAIIIKNASGNVLVRKNSMPVTRREIIYSFQNVDNINILNIPESFMFFNEDMLLTKLKRILDISQLNRKMKIRYEFDPDLNIGDKVTVYNRWGGRYDAYITKNNITIRSGIDIESEVIG